jgi:hypothetical protein
MDTLNLAPPTVPSAGAQYFAHATPQAAPPAVGAGAFIEQVVQGLRWTCDREIAALLAQVPALAWAEPHRQGWQRVKHNARREVWHANLQGRAYFLKYQFQDRGWRRLRILFRAPPCRAEWEGGLFARRCGISAVRPLAFTEQLRRGGRRCALLVTEAVEPAQPLNEFWLQLSSDADSTRRRGDTAQLIELLAELIAHSHQAGFEHLDMHAANILVQPLGARRYRTVFVDLQSARRDQPLRARAVVRSSISGSAATARWRTGCGFYGRTCAGGTNSRRSSSTPVLSS